MRFGLPCSTSRSVGEPLALGAFQGDLGAHHVVDAKSFAVAVPKVKFGKIPLQVRLGDMLVNAVDAALRIEK
jgi:hypothetical protein